MRPINSMNDVVAVVSGMFPHPEEHPGKISKRVVFSLIPLDLERIISTVGLAAILSVVRGKDRYIMTQLMRRQGQLAGIGADTAPERGKLMRKHQNLLSHHSPPMDETI